MPGSSGQQRLRLCGQSPVRVEFGFIALPLHPAVFLLIKETGDGPAGAFPPAAWATPMALVAAMWPLSPQGNMEPHSACVFG